MMEQQSKRGGARPGGGRPKAEGERHMYTVADDVHQWIMEHGGGQYLTDLVRTIRAAQQMG